MLAYPQLWAAPAAVGEHTLSAAARMDGGRTCWAGRRPHQPAEVSRWLNHSYPAAKKPEWGILFVYNGVGKAGTGLRYLNLGNIFPSGWNVRSHQSPVSAGCHRQGTISFGGSMCRDAVGTRGKRGEDMGFWGLYETVFPKEGWGDCFAPKPPLAKDSANCSLASESLCMPWAVQILSVTVAIRRTVN